MGADLELKILSSIKEDILKDSAGLAFMALEAESYEIAILDKLKSYRDKAIKELQGNEP